MLVATAGRPTIPAKPIIYTIPWNLKITAASQISTHFVAALNNGGTFATNTTAPLTGGQTSWVRMQNFGTAGTQFYLNSITTAAPVNFSGGKYFRYRVRVSANSGSIFKLFWRFADSKTAFDAGNYVSFIAAPQPTGTTQTANYLPDVTWVWDGFDPINNGVVTGTGVTSWASVGYVAIEPWSNVGNPLVDLAEVQLVTKASTKAKCVIWHDDSVKYGAQALAARMSPYGFVWNAATEWEQVLNPASTYLTQSDATAYDSSPGVYFGTHATTNAEHLNRTASQLQNQAYRNRIAVRQLGLAHAHPESFTFWGGLASDETVLGVVDQYYQTGRWNTTAIVRPEMVPPAERRLYKAALCNTAANAFTSTYQPLVDAAIATKGVASFVVHQDLGDTGATADTFRSTFDSLLAYLDSNRANIDVCTWADVMALCT